MTHQLWLQDFNSATWRRLTQTLQDRLQHLRELNDNPKLGPVETAAIRGQIAEVQQIMALHNSSASDPGPPASMPVELPAELQGLGIDLL